MKTIILSKQGYCNDLFKIVKLGANSLLIRVVVAGRGSFYYYKSGEQLLQIWTALVITNRRNGYYKL